MVEGRFPQYRHRPEMRTDEWYYKQLKKHRNPLGHPCFSALGFSDQDFLEEVGVYEFMKVYTTADIQVLPLATCFPLYELESQYEFRSLIPDDIKELRF